MMANLLDQLDQIPPCICCLCGRVRGGKVKSMAEIAKASGLPIRRVRFISRQPTWKDLSVDETERFSMACDVDLLRPRKKLFYLKRAFMSGGVRALAGGLGADYVKRKFNIRNEYETNIRHSSGSSSAAGGTRSKR